MAIKQFNGSYIVAEDRLMFRFSTDDDMEFRLWFTRFITLNLLQAIHQLTQLSLERQHRSEVAQAVQEFQEEAKESTDLNELYQEASNLPLGQEPILVTGLNLSEAENVFSIDFQLVGGQNLNIKLPMPAVQSMALLLSKLADEGAKWGSLGVVAGATIAAPTAEPDSGTTKKTFLH